MGRFHATHVMRGWSPMQNTKTVTHAIACALAATLALAPVGSALAAPIISQKNTDTRITRSCYIGAKKAKRIALKHAGVSKKACRELEAELDFDKDESVHYDVEFKVETLEYDYDIDAITGEILSFSVETDD